MPLESGTRIGPYEIVAAIGAGGMGEVYRATDSNLGRAVAIKVLPEAFARDTERLARFDREAKTLASLNHPNIAQVFGLEKGSGAQPTYALVMELVEGKTLADRIAMSAIPAEDAIPIAIQIAEALESAHDHGIVHRDLKPANIKVRDDGTVKVLDFGLAKALAPADAASGELANSPTITTPAMTNAGVIMGTAAYMSPEQAKGRVVDRRADIWAFGCVLFEMLARKRAFNGDDVSDVLVSVLRDEPDWSALPASTPVHLRALLKRCLQKDVRKRLPHIGLVRIDLSEPAMVVETKPVGGRAPAPLLAAGAVVAVALGALGMSMWPKPAPPIPAPMRLNVDLGIEPSVTPGAAIALAPDGRSLAFIGRQTDNDSAPSMLYLRHFDRLNAEPIPSTEGAVSPFYSPDGQWIGFFAGGTMKKIPISGGPAIPIAPAPIQRGAWWSTDDTIVFASAEGLTRVKASGGNAEVILRPAAGEPPPVGPQVLPGGRAVIYGDLAGSDPTASWIKLVELPGGAVKSLMRGARLPRYVSSGHLTFTRLGTMFAVPFDLEKLELVGQPVPVIEGISTTIIGGAAIAAVSLGGTAAYVPGALGDSRQSPIMWLTKAGGLAPLRAAPSTWFFPRFSPDGRRLAMAIFDGRQNDIWVYDIPRDILTRVTSDPASDLSPVFTPDGLGIVFGSTRNGNVSNLYWQRADGTGSAVRLTETDVAQLPDAISPDGKRIVLHQGDPTTTRQSLAIVPIESGPGEPIRAGSLKEFLGGPFLKANGRISPDGKWIAYSTNESGTFEIYVQPFPEGGARVQVSASGGNLALWSQTKHQLYYSGGGQGRMMVATYAITNGLFVPDKPQVWSPIAFSPAPPLATYGPGFDLHPDGERFAVAGPPTGAAAGRNSHIVLFFNFFDELRRVAPTK